MSSAQSALIKGYLEKARAKLEVARELLYNKHFDDAASRAYYAAFHAAQALLLTEGQKPDTHNGLITLFGLLFVRSGKLDRKIGKILAKLKDDDRETGDYEAVSFIDEETARTVSGKPRASAWKPNATCTTAESPTERCRSRIQREPAVYFALRSKTADVASSYTRSAPPASSASPCFQFRLSITR